MSYTIVADQNPEDILNQCTRHLARGKVCFRDSAGVPQDNLSTVCENWRFPLIQPVTDSNGHTGILNEVTFVYFTGPDRPAGKVEVVGCFGPMYQPIDLQPVLYNNVPTGYFALSLLLPVGKGYYYRFRVDGKDMPDPINPQRKMLENNQEWSFFFTDYYNYSVEFEEWEMNLLSRLVTYILPFRTKDAQNFINRFYLTLTDQQRQSMPIYKLDESVGEVNYITNILAREERHHLIDYKICIGMIDRILRSRNPYVDSWEVSDTLIQQLYSEMATGKVNGWDYTKYKDPVFFLGLLRRHSIMGAFSHPRYGGNIGGVGWAYLKEQYSMTNDLGQITGTYFNWGASIEQPLGNNADYRG